MSALSLRYLKTFHVAARHCSFKTAADELCVTASAVSHQIKQLEDGLGLPLFNRGARSLTLTAAGAQYSEQLDAVFSRQELITEQLRTRFSRQVVRLQVPAYFSSELLVPRLNAFRAAHGEVDLQIATGITPNEQHSADADVSILVGDGRWPEVHATRLFAQTYVPACSPQLLQQLDIRTPADLADAPLIVHNHRQDLWERWAVTSGVPGLQARQLIRLDNMASIVHAAEQSVGVALVSVPLSYTRFTTRSLVRLFDSEVQTGECYYLVNRPDDAQRESVCALIDWMLQQFCHESLDSIPTSSLMASLNAA